MTDDEGVAKAGAIPVIQLGESGEFIRCAAVESSPCLLGAGLRCQPAGNGQLAGKFGMRAKQCHLAVMPGRIDNGLHALRKMRQLPVITPHPLRPYCGRYPG